MLALLLALGVASSGTGAMPPVPFTTLVEGQQSGMEDAHQAVVRTAAEWKALWQKHGAGQKMPVVDFTKSTVIGVFLGSRPTGGYRVAITGIERDGAAMVVTWREEPPAAGLIVTQALTSPFHLVTVERTTADVKFTKAAR